MKCMFFIAGVFCLLPILAEPAHAQTDCWDDTRYVPCTTGTTPGNPNAPPQTTSSSFLNGRVTGYRAPPTGKLYYDLVFDGGCGDNGAAITSFAQAFLDQARDNLFLRDAVAYAITLTVQRSDSGLQLLQTPIVSLARDRTGTTWSVSCSDTLAVSLPINVPIRLVFKLASSRSPYGNPIFFEFMKKGAQYAGYLVTAGVIGSFGGVSTAVVDGVVNSGRTNLDEFLANFQVVETSTISHQLGPQSQTLQFRGANGGAISFTKVAKVSVFLLPDATGNRVTIDFNSDIGRAIVDQTAVNIGPFMEEKVPNWLTSMISSDATVASRTCDSIRNALSTLYRNRDEQAVALWQLLSMHSSTLNQTPPRSPCLTAGGRQSDIGRLQDLGLDAPYRDAYSAQPARPAPAPVALGTPLPPNPIAGVIQAIRGPVYRSSARVGGM